MAEETQISQMGPAPVLDGDTAWAHVSDIAVPANPITYRANFSQIVEWGSAALPRKLGWGKYQDTLYTSTSPLAVNNNKVQLTNNGLGPGTYTGMLPPDVPSLWNPVDNTLRPGHENSVIQGVLHCTCMPSINNSYFSFAIEDAVTATPTVFCQIVLTRDSAVTAVRCEEFMFPVSASNAVNGLKLFLDTTQAGDNIDFYDISLTLFIAFRP